MKEEIPASAPACNSSVSPTTTPSNNPSLVYPTLQLGDPETMFALLQKQKTSYQQLWNRYKTMESDMQRKEHDTISQLTQRRVEKDAETEKIIEFWKARANSKAVEVKNTERIEQLKAMCLSYKEKADSLHAHAVAARQALELSKEKCQRMELKYQSAKEINDTFQVLTGLQLSRSSHIDPTTVCTARNSQDGRELVFSVCPSSDKTNQDELCYRGVDVQLGEHAPAWMSEMIEFPTDKAPLLLKRVVEAVFTP
jgi:hypothetical protein